MAGKATMDIDARALWHHGDLIVNRHRDAGSSVIPTSSSELRGVSMYRALSCCFSMPSVAQTAFIASIMTTRQGHSQAPECTALPRLVVFDLDDCCWTPE